jgi:hypothetical protein
VWIESGIGFRPPLVQDRLQLRADGRVLVMLKTAWHDSTSQLLFVPLESLEKLAALTPRPAISSERSMIRRMMAYGEQRNSEAS